jgi:nucleoside-diphosphate-sugar epimerase
MSKAIIGYTGFVGSNLISQQKFDDFYNSKNIESIQGKSYDLVVCAGAPAVKWLANKEPIKDKENLQKLMDCLAQVSTNKLILISTVDVYPTPVQVDEDTKIDPKILQPYGKHRLELEQFVQENFNSLVVRLPGLFGEGLKKNIIYDFLNDNIGDWINKDSVFQFYNLAHLWEDLAIALDHELKLVNFATEPVSVAEVALEAFGFEFSEEPKNNPANYDMRTKYFDLFSSDQQGYLYGKKIVFQELREFVLKQKSN